MGFSTHAELLLAADVKHKITNPKYRRLLAILISFLRQQISSTSWESTSSCILLCSGKKSRSNWCCKQAFCDTSWRKTTCRVPRSHAATYPLNDIRRFCRFKRHLPDPRKNLSRCPTITKCYPLTIQIDGITKKCQVIADEMNIKKVESPDTYLGTPCNKCLATSWAQSTSGLDE